MKAKVSFRLRVTVEDRSAVGPGKINLLEAIVNTGSIRAAAKEMKMSYNRAWLLVDELNYFFKKPVVVGSKGGSNGGGTVVTPLGLKLIEEYRTIEEEMYLTQAKRLKKILAMLKKDEV